MHEQRADELPAAPGSNGPGDGEIVREVLAGDERAYARLVRRYKDVLYRYAERMTGRPDDAADIVQQTFIKGYRNLDRCRDPEKVGGWLFRITVNLCKDHLKSRRRHDVSLDAPEAQVAARQEPTAGAEQAEIREEIFAALQKLSPDQREAFVLKHVEGWPYEDMSERLDVSVSALKMRVHRARDELQELLKRYR